jgi:SH3-like domain-containing protein
VSRLPIFALFTFLVGLSLPVQAIEYRTVETATILYDTPSLRGTKLFVIRRDTPVELVVPLEGWLKVRDAEGSMAWIEKKNISERRTVIVRTERASILRKNEEGAPLSFEAERDVSLDYLETLPGGWIKVHHRDGQEGFVRAGEVWGF